MAADVPHGPVNAAIAENERLRVENAYQASQIAEQSFHIGDLALELARLKAEIERLRLVVAECLDQYPRFVQLYEEHPMGTAEYRLGEAMLDALDKFRKAKTAEAAEGVSDAD